MRPHTPRRFGTTHLPLAADGLPVEGAVVLSPRHTPRDALLLAAYSQLQQDQRPRQGPSVVAWRPPTRNESRSSYLGAPNEEPAAPSPADSRPPSTCQTRPTPMYPPKGCPFSRLSPRTTHERGATSPRVEDADIGYRSASARFSLIDVPPPTVRGATYFARTTSREQDAFAKGVGPAPTVTRLQTMMNTRTRLGLPEGRNEALEMLLEDYNNMVMGHRQESTIRAKAAMRNNHRFQRYSLSNRAQNDNVLRPHVPVAKIIRPKAARAADRIIDEAKATSADRNGGNFFVPPPPVIHSAADMTRTTGRDTKVAGCPEPCDALCFAAPPPAPVMSLDLRKLTPRPQSAHTNAYRGFLYSANDNILHSRPRSAMLGSGFRSNSGANCRSPTKSIE